MASGKYIAVDANGNLTEEQAVQTGGAGKEDKIVRTDAGGQLDPSFLPDVEVTDLVASENLAAGDMVNVFNDTGVVKMRKADASAANAGKVADGFILTAVNLGVSGRFYGEGKNSQLTGLTLGAIYFLSGTAPGEVTATPPTTSGHCLQVVGKAISATTLLFERGEPVIRV